LRTAALPGPLVVDEIFLADLAELAAKRQLGALSTHWLVL